MNAALDCTLLCCIGNDVDPQESVKDWTYSTTVTLGNTIIASYNKSITVADPVLKFQFKHSYCDNQRHEYREENDQIDSQKKPSVCWICKKVRHGIYHTQGKKDQIIIYNNGQEEKPLQSSMNKVPSLRRSIMYRRLEGGGGNKENIIPSSLEKEEKIWDRT